MMDLLSSIAGVLQVNYEGVKNNGHLAFRVTTRDSRARVFTTAQTPSDRRGVLNLAGDVRRFARGHEQ